MVVAVLPSHYLVLVQMGHPQEDQVVQWQYRYLPMQKTAMVLLFQVTVYRSLYPALLVPR